MPQLSEPIPVLDDGFVRYVDHLGSDASIVEAARLTAQSEGRSAADDRQLLRYLIRHRHTTPLEFCELVIHIRIPMDAWRQMIRHRTASVNEYSTRYSEAIDSAQRTDPERWRLQAKSNRQGSEGTVTEWPDYAPLKEILGGHFDPEAMESFDTPGDWLSSQEKVLQEWARQVYAERLAFGVAKEQARKDLPLSTYTEAYWKCDLHNLLHFLSLRLDAHAQEEIRAYAVAIARIVAELFPETWGAFNDYRLNAVTLTALDIEAIRLIQGGCPESTALLNVFTNKREREECKAKLATLGLMPVAV